MLNTTKRTLTAFMFAASIFTMPLMTVSAAEVDNSSNPQRTTAPVTNSVESSSDASTYSIEPRAAVTYHQTVTGTYGLVFGCTAKGTNNCTTSSGAKTAASFSTKTTFNHSDGTSFSSGKLSGSSTASKNYTWDAGDGSSYYTVNSTTTVTTCTKSGYSKRTLTTTTNNPYL